MSLYARLTLALILLLALAATHWRAYTTGTRHERQATQAAQTQATRHAAAQAIEQATTTQKATHDRAQTERRISADRTAADRELDRLRHDLATARAAAQSASACTPDATAPSRDQLLAAMARDIEHLAEQGTALAQAADGHAADALMLWQACH